VSVGEVSPRAGAAGVGGFTPPISPAHSTSTIPRNNNFHASSSPVSVGSGSRNNQYSNNSNRFGNRGGGEWYPSSSVSPNLNNSSNLNSGLGGNDVSLGGVNRSRWRGMQVEQVKEFIPPGVWQQQREHDVGGGNWVGVSNSLASGHENGFSPNTSNGIHNSPYNSNASHQNQYQPSTTVTTNAINNEKDDGNDNLEPWWHDGDSLSSTLPAPQSHNVRNLHSLGMHSNLWNHYRDMARETLREMEPNDPRIKAVPPCFGSVFCLDRDLGDNNRCFKAGSFGYPSQTFKVQSMKRGSFYTLRRYDNVKQCLSHKITSTISQKYSTLIKPSSGACHPGICQLYDCFIHQRALFFVHDYCPNAVTLADAYLNNNGDNGIISGSVMAPLSERIIWSYVTQLVSVIRYMHSRRMACRSLQPQHVLLVGGGGGEGMSDGSGRTTRRKVRVSCVGVMDVLEFEARKGVADLQREDMINLGELILSLTTRTHISSTTDPETYQSCVSFLAQNYSPDLQRLTMALLNHNPQQPPTLFNILNLITPYAWEELDCMSMECSGYEEELRHEYESGRSLRLLLKLGFVNERPEFGMDSQWAETGDRYVLKLFRDFVFHQADSHGHPILDLGHVVSSLNKLDAADTEKIVLTSRDGTSMLVVSYCDVALCLESAYGELCRKEGSLRDNGEGNGAGAGVGVDDHHFKFLSSPSQQQQRTGWGVMSHDGRQGRII